MQICTGKNLSGDSVAEDGGEKKMLVLQQTQRAGDRLSTYRKEVQEVVRKLCLRGEEAVEGVEEDRRQPAEDKGGEIIGR